MVRLSHDPITPSRRSDSSSLNDLNRLLSRLQHNILHADAERERRLRTSEYERNKAGVNLEYARTLLTKLEQDAAGIKTQARRQEMQADLNQKRDVFEQLMERLRELEEVSVDSDEGDSEEEDEEDLLADLVVRTPSESMGSRGEDEDDGGDAWGAGMEDAYEEESTVIPEQHPRQWQSEPEPAAVEATRAPVEGGDQPVIATETEQSLRARKKGPEAQVDTAETSARKQLFGNRTATSTTAVSTTATTEAILDHHREEQDKLTESLLNMATALKSSSHAFATSLEGEKDILSTAGSGLEKNETALEAASRRMGFLTRMSEGEGWFGRMKLYGMIFAMMVVAILIVFVLPKLRF
ncbi:uncharacterized protein BCR38DRAFT_437071 [Pseudomassariella vexata]|uniref:Synaptobrevin n=1 Tax=Pseudomassariella vexata TaxID=1141098 RepID=A0A1Y2DW61_9PEZI|nr:uncharacterized protein BCR38DRAFT_437071 [Pseudomassariella vexata]ORY63530.1 hypothetical protein BCR38DRAFT_437071 [Pseudomassariella vexata]